MGLKNPFVSLERTLLSDRWLSQVATPFALVRQLVWECTSLINVADCRTTN